MLQYVCVCFTGKAFIEFSSKLKQEALRTDLFCFFSLTQV